MSRNTKNLRLDEDGEEIRSKFLSNHTNYSPTDSDAKISNYAGQLVVDDKNYVITGACASTVEVKTVPSSLRLWIKPLII